MDNFTKFQNKTNNGTAQEQKVPINEGACLAYLKNYIFECSFYHFIAKVEYIEIIFCKRTIAVVICWPELTEHRLR